MKKIITYFIILLLIISTISPANVEAATIKLNKKKVTIGVGNTVTLKLKGTKKKVRWSTSDKKIATVKKGVVKGIKAGKAVILAKVGSKKFTCNVTVKPSLNMTKATVKLKDKLKLTVKGAPKKITWKSSNKTVATVKKGIVKALNPGKTTITAKTGKYSLSCDVIVLPDQKLIDHYYNNLKTYLNTSGTTDEEGNLYITDSIVETADGITSKIDIKITYLKSTNTYQFDMNMLQEESESSMTLELNMSFLLCPDTVLTEKQPLKIHLKVTEPTIGIADFTATTSIQPPLYDMMEETLHFDYVVNSAESEAAKEYIELLKTIGYADLFTMTGFMAWDTHLYEWMNVSFQDLGFVTMESAY